LQKLFKIPLFNQTIIMKKNQIVLWILCLACTPLFLVSCDKVKDWATIDVPIGEFSIDIPIDLAPAPAAIKGVKSAAGDFYSFYGKSDPVSLESFSEIQKYLGNTITLLVSDVSIKITVTNGAGTTVKNLTSTTKEGESTIYNYTKDGNIDLSQSFSDSKLTDYVKNFFKAVQEGKTVVADAAGETDIVYEEITGASTVITILATLKAEIKLLK
jgi:hypothetical protein